MRPRRATALAAEFSWPQVKPATAKRPASQRFNNVTPLTAWAPASNTQRTKMYSRGSLVWNEAEDHRLIKTLIEMGNVRWVDVAERMPGRSGENCRDRYHKYISKMVKYRHLVPDDVREIRKRGAPKSKPAYDSGDDLDDDCDDDNLLNEAAERAVADVFGGDVFGVQLPGDVSTDDKFCFEDMLGLGAMPHVAKPVAPGLPSPGSMAALPTFAPLPARKPPAPPAPPQVPATPAVSKTSPPGLHVRVVPRVFGSKARATSIVCDQFTERNFADINAMLRRPLVKPIAKNKKQAMKAPGIVFNPRLVKSMA